MIRKGLFTIVCLTVLSAVVAWAAIVTNYNVQTKTTNLGGTIQVRNGVALSGAGAIRYTNFTTSAAVDVTITPSATHKISAITKNGVTTSYANQTAPVTVSVQKPAPVDPLRPTVLATQSVVATFAVRSEAGVVSKVWQLQTKNNNAGGTITTTRGTDPAKVLAAVGTLVLKNYPDTTPVNVAVAANPGYTVDKVTLNGAVQGSSFTVNPANTGKVFTVLATYKKLPLAVTTGAGILPVNPTTVYGGSLSFVVTPTGASNTVTGVTVNGTCDVTMTDSEGNVLNPASLSVMGPVKVTLSNIQSAVSVTGSYRTDLKSADIKNCTSTCHLTGSAATQAVPAEWQASAHYANNVTCTTCHSTMPGPIVKASVDKTTYRITNASAGTVGEFYCAKCHSNSLASITASKHYTTTTQPKLVCSSCHSSVHNPVASAAACSACHTNVTGHTAQAMGTKSCTDCHDSHNPAATSSPLAANSGHPAVTLYTFEEVAMQMNGGNPVPVQVDASGKGLPYSPKQTCGTSGCHVKNGVDYTYDKITDHAFHSAQGRNEYMDTADGKLDARKNKPWGQSTAMVGKW